MKKKIDTFASLLLSFQPRFDLHMVFEDFLTLTLCSFSRNPETGLSYQEDLYLSTIEKYKNEELRFLFPKMLASLINEMENRFDGDTGWDILGEFYEQHLPKKGFSQFFTPWPICTFMAKCSFDEAQNASPDKPLKILEPACGSGRMLLACKKERGTFHEYYAVDIDATCVKMTAINLFLSGMFYAEVMCANPLIPESFNFSYKISFVPFGVFRVTEKTESRLWNILKSLDEERQDKKTKPKEWEPLKKDDAFKGGDQLKFF